MIYKKINIQINQMIYKKINVNKILFKILTTTILIPKT